MTLMNACHDRELLLCTAADAIARGRDDEARRQLDRLMAGLELPRDLTWQIFGSALGKRIDHRAPTENLYLRDLEVSQISLFNVLAEHLPLVGMAGRIGNELLAGYLAHRDEATLLDLGIGTAQQEVALIELLAARGALPRHLHVIAIEPGKGCLEESARVLRAVAGRVGLSLSFSGHETVAEALTEADWQAIAAESRHLVINAAFAAHHIQGTDGTPVETRDRVFRRLRALQPAAMVLLEPDSDHLNPDFAARFAACWRHFGAIFRYLDRLPIDAASRAAVKLFFSREIEDILANSEATRAERHESADAWAARLARTGYTARAALPFAVPAAVDAVGLAVAASRVDLVVDGVGLASVLCAEGETTAWIDTRPAGEPLFAVPATAPSPSAARPQPSRIAEVMSVSVSTITVGSSLREAARLFNRSGAGDLVVLGRDGRYAGTLSEGDLIRTMIPPSRLAAGDAEASACEHLLRNGRRRGSDTIDALVVRDALVLAPDDDLLRAADIMVLRQIRRLPVVDGTRVVGSVSRADLCGALLDA